VKHRVPADAVTFVALAFAGAWSIEIGLRPYLPFAARGALAMLMPGAAALLVRGPVCRTGFAGDGLAPRLNGAWPVYAAAYGIVPLAGLAGFGLSLASGVQHAALASPAQVLAAFGSASAENASETPISAGLAALVAAGALTVFIPLNLPFTFGEEYGWRGYLLPRLARYGPVYAAVAVGVVWGLWHAPLIALDGYVYPGHPVAGVLCMVLLTTSLSIIFAWLRFRSRSVWPSALAHAAFNAQSNLAYLVLSPADSLLRPPGGLCAIAPLAAAALWIVASGQLEKGRDP
jgi:uncharacterized protein